jgi:hypothetical protein
VLTIRLIPLMILCECPFCELCDLVGVDMNVLRYEMHVEDSRAPSITHPFGTLPAPTCLRDVTESHPVLGTARSWVLEGALPSSCPPQDVLPGFHCCVGCY